MAAVLTSLAGLLAGTAAPGAAIAADTGTPAGAPLPRIVSTLAGSAGGGTAGSRGYAGDGGPATAASVALHHPGGVAVDLAGDTFIADTDNNVVRMIAAHTGTLFGQRVQAGDIYTVAGDGFTWEPGVPGTGGFSGDGGPATAAELNQPESVAVDAGGNLYIADTSNDRIREVAATGHLQYGIAMRAGDIYTIAGDGTAGFSGDGGDATGAELSAPEGVALDHRGDLFIADTYNNRIREIPAGPGDLGLFGVAGPAQQSPLSPRATLFEPINGEQPGLIYTIAGNGMPGFAGDGGTGSQAELHRPVNLAIDRAGDVFFTDQDNGRVRELAAVSGSRFGRVMARGDIYTVAGGGQRAPTRAGVPALAARLESPWGIAVDGAGDVLISDADADTIDILAATTHQGFGTELGAGRLARLAGLPGTLGCGEGPAAGARFTHPAGLARDAQGNVDVAGPFCERIAQISGN